MDNILVEEIIEHIEMLKEEQDIGKRFREKATMVISLLQSDAPLKIEKALLELEEISNDLPSYHRTQVWDVISRLESVK